jgi:hypothetical protein
MSAIVPSLEALDCHLPIEAETSGSCFGAANSAREQDGNNNRSTGIDSCHGGEQIYLQKQGEVPYEPKRG